MQETHQRITIKTRFARLGQSMQKGLLTYPLPLFVCMLISGSAVALNLFDSYSGAGIDALFSAQPWFQSLWVTLAFCFVTSASACRIRRRGIRIFVHSTAVAVFFFWFFLAKHNAAQPIVQFDLFRVLLIFLLYLAAICILPCADGKNFCRFVVDAAQKSLAAFCAVTILLIGVTILTLAAGILLDGGDLGIIPNAASILYGIVLPVLMCGALVPKPSYPPYLKVVRRFVGVGLVPILAALGVVFYLYLFKILITGVWPSNQVSPFVIFGSCVGAVFIIFFCGSEEDDRTAKLFCRIFPVFWLLPMAMLFICAGMRIASQGLTPMRALLVGFGVWMVGSLALVFFQREHFHAKWLPIFAAALLCLALFLPYGNIFSLSRHMQTLRLDHALAEADMGDHEAIRPNANATDEQKRIILSATDYLLDETNAQLFAQTGQPIMRGELQRLYGFTNIPQQESVDYGWCFSDYSMLDTTDTRCLISGLYQYEDREYIDVGYVQDLGHIACDDEFTLVITNGEEQTRYPMRHAIVQAVGAYLRGEEQWYVFELDNAPIRVVLNEVYYEKNADDSIRLRNVDFSLLILSQ